jgi:hypothetical protein
MAEEADDRGNGVGVRDRTKGFEDEVETEA